MKFVNDIPFFRRKNKQSSLVLTDKTSSTADNTKHHFCEQCAALDLRSIIARDGESYENWMKELGHRTFSQQTSDIKCSLCLMLYENRVEPPHVRENAEESIDYSVVACSSAYLQMLPEVLNPRMSEKEKNILEKQYDKGWDDAVGREELLGTISFFAIPSTEWATKTLLSSWYRGSLIPICKLPEDDEKENAAGKCGILRPRTGQSSGTDVNLATSGRKMDLEKIDFSLIQDWISVCINNHFHQRRLPPSSPVEVAHTLKSFKFRLIDCQTQQMFLFHEMPSTKIPHFVALSYVWGQTELHVHKLKGGRRLRVVEDAMDVALKLGFRYLWVDQLCIDQEDPEDVAAQIEHMGVIYSSAALTIIDAASEHADQGLPGCGSRLREGGSLREVTHPSGIVLCPTARPPQQVIAESRWATRGWTFQEGYLSSRRLVFTAEQVYFECESCYAFESIRWPLKRFEQFISSFQMVVRKGYFAAGCTVTDTSGNAKSLDQVQQIINSLWHREYKKITDILDGAQGVLGCFVDHVYGLPYRFLQDRSTFALAESLLWEHSGNEVVRVTQFPSFTWAGWAARDERLQFTWDDGRRMLPLSDVKSVRSYYVGNHLGNSNYAYSKHMLVGFPDFTDGKMTKLRRSMLRVHSTVLYLRFISVTSRDSSEKGPKRDVIDLLKVDEEGCVVRFGNASPEGEQDEDEKPSDSQSEAPYLRYPIHSTGKMLFGTRPRWSRARSGLFYSADNKAEFDRVDTPIICLPLIAEKEENHEGSGQLGAKFNCLLLRKAKEFPAGTLASVEEGYERVGLASFRMMITEWEDMCRQYAVEGKSMALV